MEKNRSAKIIAIIALLVAVAGVSVGFAAFSNTLTIEAEGHYHADARNFDVNFLSLDDANNDTASEYVIAYDEASSIVNGGFASDLYVDNSDPSTSVINKIHVDFHNPGEKFVYNFLVRNDGKYDAYLNSVEMGKKTCTPIEGTEGSKVVDAEGDKDDMIAGGVTSGENSQLANACNDIVMTLNIDTDTFIDGTIKNSSNIASKDLLKGTSKNASLIIEYKKTEPQTIVDGDFAVDFEESVLTYVSASAKTN